ADSTSSSPPPWALRWARLPSAVRTFSTQSPSRRCRAHRRGQKRRSFRADNGRKSSSAGSVGTNMQRPSSGRGVHDAMQPHTGHDTAVADVLVAPVVHGIVILKTCRERTPFFESEIDPAKQAVRVRAAEFRLAAILVLATVRLRADVLEIVNATDVHLGPGSRLVVAEEVAESIEEEAQVLLVETGPLGEDRGEEYLGPEQRVGDNVLVPH